MRMLKASVVFCLLFVISAGSGCSSTDEYLLAGHYKIKISEDGEPSLYFNDPRLGTTYLQYAFATGTAKDYLVVCGDSCYLFLKSAETVEDARRARIGPLTDAALKQKVFQLTGDSLKLESVL